ncbi:hypothetical protein LEP1GSC062_4016 [Leptospira alexanderi serovar Manhao 3 str. L 60]|uniref:Uncharacterized protein n=1 Tax=Leptospira alexanderi serovar Manhao 3 str. L 60 TaxID=1049759 RepID=V6I4C3_9LEPT|nr:hypothetical protein LEP1GSC062_4016 [Leptospira alexanderi serovar Manhao 3 str. L 60]
MLFQLYKSLYDLKAKINFSTFIREVYRSRMQDVYYYQNQMRMIW